MLRRFGSVLTAMLLALAACGDDDDGNGNGNGGDAGLPDAGTTDGGEGDGGVVTEECEKEANLNRIAELTAGQPEVEGRAKGLLTTTTSFQSLADDPAVTCTVELEFKDLNGNETLDPYEDWTLTPDERATDLLARMTDGDKAALMAHATLTDDPGSDSGVSAGLQEQVGSGLRFGKVTVLGGPLEARATWANNLQELAESSELGIPFMLSLEPAHASGLNREKAAGFSQWPQELGLAATAQTDIVRTYGEVVAKELRALGIRMALSPSADLATDPRWARTPYTFGEDAAQVGEMVTAYIDGLQGETFGQASVAAVVNYFPGAGAATDGWDARLEKGRFLTYPGNAIDQHLSTFAAAIDAGVLGVMPAYGIPETGDWSGLDGLIDGSAIEQVGVSFNDTLVTGVLREHYGFGGLVLAPWGVLDEPGPETLGAPWGVETLSLEERIAEAVNAGVDQFGGLADGAAVIAARDGGLVTDAQIDAAAARALALMFRLGIFEDPFVDPMAALRDVNADASYRAGLNAMNRSMVLLVNVEKPEGWLNGQGDGTQTADKGNAGNGSLRVLPAPPGEPYVAAGCSYYIMGDFDLDYVRSVSAGYGELTNDLPNMTPAERIAYSDYVFVRIPAPYTPDPDSGELEFPLQSLEYASNANADVLEDLAFARDAIDTAGSQTQIVVGVDSGRPSVMSEVMGYDVSGLYVEWGVTDKVFLDVAFGIVDGTGTLPVGLPASDAAAETQLEDVAGDGQHDTFVEGHGIQTDAF